MPSAALFTLQILRLTSDTLWIPAQPLVCFHTVPPHHPLAHHSREQMAAEFPRGEKSPRSSPSVSRHFCVLSFWRLLRNQSSALIFWHQHHLLVDPSAQQVLEACSLKPVSAAAASAPSGRSRFTASLCHVSPAVRSLLAAFPTVVSDGSGTPRPKHGVQHFIETTGRPIFAKARRLDPDKLRTAESEFRALEKAGIVRRSNSPWSSPLHMVPKADGTWRPCGDYRRLNLATKHDRYPLPSILDLSSKLHGCRYFSVIDLVKGYHQVPMVPEDIQKTAIITPFGLFEYLFMPFGLMNAAQTFQRLMDRLFGHFPFLFTYLDDHLIASKTLEEHMDHLSQFSQSCKTMVSPSIPQNAPLRSRPSNF
jgi:hypothetical protein